MNERCQKGYILVTTVLILAVATIIVTGLIYRVNNAVPFVQSVIEREKALLLGHSGIAYVQALVTFQADVESANKEEKKKEGDQKETDKEIKVLLARVLPLINRWTEFKLNPLVDGFDGTVHLYVSSEEGKINLNKAYDFNKKNFITTGANQAGYVDDQRKLVLAACKLLEKAYKVNELFEKLEKFLKTADGPLNDISDLLCVPGFEQFRDAVFPNALHDTEKQLYLADMFTVAGVRAKLNPWFFSRSVKQLCGISEQSGELDKNNKKTDELVKQFSRTVPDWEKEWKKIFAQRYQKTIQQLPKGISALFDLNCVPQLLTVISVGKIDKTSCSVVAFIEVIETRQNNQISYESRIKRSYVIE